MNKCKLQNRPSVAVLQLRLLCLFCVNLVISSWCCTWPALKTWKRFFKKKIGYEQNEDEKCTRPKHKIIADAYAKRMDDIISVSIENSHTDPAGINFDMNNLNTGESDTMGATLTNYLCNIINRRNAVTMTQMDYAESNVNAINPYGNSYDDNNSEISVSVRHFSVESRRNSVDSQVSQVSVKMSEIKATVESHLQKHKGVNMKSKKRHHNYLYARRTNRRASSSSIESQRIINQMQNIQYNYPNNRIQLSANTIDQQIERRSAMTTATMDDINNIRHRLFNQNDLLDQSEQGDSSNSLDDNKQAVIEKVLKNLLKNSNEHQIEALLNNYEQNGNDDGTRNSQRHNKLSEMEVNIASSISLSQSFDSEQSINCKITQSQNSKSSCDIGIQANDFDIASHACQQSQQSYQQIMNNGSGRNQLNYQRSHRINHDTDYTETHQLLPYRKRDAPTIVRKDTLSGKHLSDSEKMEKLKQLLLPSK